MLYLLYRLVEESDFKKVVENRACFVLPCFLKMRALNYFPPFKNASSNSRLRYWQEFANNFLRLVATTSAIRHGVMQFEALKQFSRETEMSAELSWGVRVSKNAYRCCNAFSSKVKQFAFVFRLQGAISKIVAHGTEEFDDKRRLLKNVIQIAQSDCEPNIACLTKRTLICYLPCASLHHDKGKAFMMYQKGRDLADRELPKQAIPPPRISAPNGNYQIDSSRWFGQSLQNR